MPTYDFVDTETGDCFEKFMSISAKEEYLKENPHIQQMLVSAPAMVSSAGTSNKVPDGFKEVLAKIGENHAASKIGAEHGNKTMAQIKAQEIVKKHREKHK